MTDKKKAYHITSDFTLQAVEEPKEEGARPKVTVTTYTRGQMVADETEMADIDDAWEQGLLGHNAFHAVMISKSFFAKAEAEAPVASVENKE